MVVFITNTKPEYYKHTGYKDNNFAKVLSVRKYLPIELIFLRTPEFNKILKKDNVNEHSISVKILFY